MIPVPKPVPCLYWVLMHWHQSAHGEERVSIVSHKIQTKRKRECVYLKADETALSPHAALWRENRGECPRHSCANKLFGSVIYCNGRITIITDINLLPYDYCTTLISICLSKKQEFEHGTKLPSSLDIVLADQPWNISWIWNDESSKQEMLSSADMKAWSRSCDEMLRPGAHAQISGSMFPFGVLYRVLCREVEKQKGTGMSNSDSGRA